MVLGTATLDIRMPPTHTEGLWAALEIRERRPEVGVLVLSRHIEDTYAAQLPAAGAAIDPEVVRRLGVRTTHADPPARLTPRERTVLEALAEGHTNTAIGRKLHISLSAVEKNLNAIFDKPDLKQGPDYNRRILAVLRYLES